MRKNPESSRSAQRSVFLDGQEVAHLRGKRRKVVLRPDGEPVERPWSREDLAEKVGCDQRTIFNAEHGKPIRIPLAETIARILGTTLQNLVVPSGHPDLAILTGSDPAQEALFTAASHCYEQLFPPEQRADPEDIRIALVSSHSATHGSYPWDEVYLAMHTRNKVKGMTWLTGRKSSPQFWWGNYFGILPAWRGGHTDWLLKEIGKLLLKRLPKAAWIAGIVERVDDALLSSVADSFDSNTAETPLISSHPRRGEIIQSLRALRRLSVYNSLQALVLTDRNKGDWPPVDFITPRIEFPLRFGAFGTYFLLIFPLRTAQPEPSLTEIVSFVYDVYRHEHDGTVGGIREERWTDHVAIVQKELEARINPATASFTRILIPHRYIKLIRVAKTEGLADEIEI